MTRTIRRLVDAGAASSVSGFVQHALWGAANRTDRGPLGRLAHAAGAFEDFAYDELEELA